MFALQWCWRTQRQGLEMKMRFSTRERRGGTARQFWEEAQQTESPERFQLVGAKTLGEVLSRAPAKGTREARAFLQGFAEELQGVAEGQGEKEKVAMAEVLAGGVVEALKRRPHALTAGQLFGASAVDLRRHKALSQAPKPVLTCSFLVAALAAATPFHSPQQQGLLFASALASVRLPVMGSRDGVFRSISRHVHVHLLANDGIA